MSQRQKQRYKKVKKSNSITLKNNQKRMLQLNQTHFFQKKKQENAIF
ncbi:hypothetical protein HMPREF1981_01549 [Bacteroides pyogenes F0041]|uniref:Uncharacterized protein n=1 Tax=Bacteroides pyogenes F0041 TaxID=1321819 RepID=U2CNG9_9BACE|nr:hypothetical protein HMPREF1981_01549 [Bacteroides pyogenes F0041]MBB3896008.1 hypothetical protein [Bacteroides pyogenes]SUV36158.1 Uncharacterised protein [Bacteroides pyogenes]